MIKDMYNVMQRIHEIRQRFGLNRSSEQVNSGSDSYSKVHDRALADADKNMKSSEKRVSADPTRSEINSLADHYAGVNSIPSSLVKAVIENESGYNNRAVSPKGAMGLMQLMPSVAREFGVGNPFSAEENIRAGTSLLGDLLKEYNGDYKLALSAYNAGRGAVEKHEGVPEYKETKEYVQKVIQSYLKNK